MRIRASNGKLYNPDKSTIIDKYEFSDGHTESLMRSINGAYFIYITPEPKVKSKSIMPMTYDESLKWVDKYSSRDKVEGIMIYNEPKKIYIMTSEKTESCIKQRSALLNRQMKDIISEAIIAYAKHLEETKE